METARKRRKAIVDEAHCVACGCCVKVCPLRSIEIVQGLTARVNEEKCVGCGKCARECPASVIAIREVGACKSVGMISSGLLRCCISRSVFSTFSLLG